MNPYVSTSIKDSIKIKKIVHCLSFEFDSQYKDHPEAHDFWEFVYVESGSARFECDGKTIDLVDNDILFHPPNCTHLIKSINTPKAKMHFVSFASSSDELLALCDKKFSLSYILKKELFMLLKEAECTFERVVSERKDFLKMSQNAPLGGGQLYKMYLEGFLIKLVRFVNSHDFVNPKNDKQRLLYVKMTDILIDNVKNDYDITKLCSELNYGKTYLSKVFKKFSDCSIMYWYNMQRVEYAKKLISTDKYNLKEISDMMGFNNQYYFSRVFKKYEGISPSEYKRRQ